MEGRKMRTEIDWHRKEHVAPPGEVHRVPQSATLTGKRRRLARLLALLHRGERGSALVEFAMVLPMMLILTTGIMMFGIAMNNYLALTNAVSIGARTVSINAGLTLDPCAIASAAIISASPGLNPANLTYSYTFNGIAASGTTCLSSSTSTGAAGNLSSGTTVTVTATYPLNLSVFGTKYSASNAVLSATSTELVQ
jgi:Flp pilus assembly protein TadG